MKTVPPPSFISFVLSRTSPLVSRLSFLSQLGREEPAMSMDSSGKVMWARHSEVQQANLKAMGDTEVRDGERLPLGVKDMGSCEIYPQTIQHSPNGR